MSDWINHVKAVQKKHGVSYKEAMQLAKATYKKQSGGGIPKPSKQVSRKAKNTANKISKGIDTFSPLITAINPPVGLVTTALNQTYKNVNGAGNKTLKSTGKYKPSTAINGGSFRVSGIEQRGGKINTNTNYQSSMLNYAHPIYSNAQYTRSMKDKLINN